MYPVGWGIGGGWVVPFLLSAASLTLLGFIENLVQHLSIILYRLSQLTPI